MELSRRVLAKLPDLLDRLALGGGITAPMVQEARDIYPGESDQQDATRARQNARVAQSLGGSRGAGGPDAMGKMPGFIKKYLMLNPGATARIEYHPTKPGVIIYWFMQSTAAVRRTMLTYALKVHLSYCTARPSAASPRKIRHRTLILKPYAFAAAHSGSHPTLSPVAQ